MRKTGWKQLALSIAGVLLSRISIMGCYPFVPAFFAAVYLEENGRWHISRDAGRDGCISSDYGNCEICNGPSFNRADGAVV